MKNKLFKGILVVIGAVIFSTISIFAADTMRGVERDFGILSRDGGGGCAAGMSAFNINEQVVCVDMYEASPGELCPYSIPQSALESERNANTSGCYAASIEGEIPWSFVSLPQAQRMCAGAGKRLPTSAEWYHIALGTDADACIIKATSPQVTGTVTCVSGGGVFDAVGNVWEWVDETVVGNTFDGRTLPEEGYITSVDASGVAITSGIDKDELYGADYIWSKSEGVFGMIRGGFYGSETDAGLYTINASVPTSFASQGVGFRCVEDML